MYRATITRTDTNTTESYTGATYRSFHKRYLEHMNDMRNPARDGTTLSGHIWYLKGLQVPYTIKWEIAGRAQPFNPATGQCRLCLLEKYYIMFNKDGASLNQRTEFFSHCYHKAPLLLSKQKFTWYQAGCFPKICKLTKFSSQSLQHKFTFKILHNNIKYSSLSTIYHTTTFFPFSNLYLI